MRRYYSPEDIAALAAVTTYAELAKIGIGVLRGMHDRYASRGATIVQVCGPMSSGGFGDLDVNMRVFGAAIDILDQAAHGGQDNPEIVVFDQIPCQGAIVAISGFTPGSPYDGRILTDFYGPLFRAGYVKRAIFLPNWQSSRGAKWERGVLAEIGIEIAEYPPELYGRALARCGIRA